MSCQRVHELLPRHVDQDLEGEELALVTQHLATCQACRLRLDLHRELLAGLVQLPAPAEAAQVAARLRRSVLREAGRQRAWGPFWRLAGALGDAVGWAAVAAVAVLLLAALALSGRSMLEARPGRRTPAATATTASPSPTPPATPAPTATAQAEAAGPPAGLTPSPSATVPAVRHDYPEFGFSAELPADWAVMRSEPWSRHFHNDRPEFTVTFRDPGYPGQMWPYTIYVTVQGAAGQTLSEAVEEWLAPVAQELRPSIVRRPLVVGGEPAVEMVLATAWGRAVMVVHDGRVYLISGLRAARGSHPAGEAACKGFLASFAFLPMAGPGLPAAPPGLTPAPTPTAPPTMAARPTPAPAGQTQPAISSLVVTPDQPPILYTVIESHLYRSVDQGRSWTEESLAGLPDGCRLNRVAIDYRHPATMYALTDQGIYRREGQATWGLVNTLRATALAVDLADPNVLWAGIYRTGEYDAAIVKSEDGGRTWGKADYGVELVASWAADIAVDPRNANTLWAVVRADGGREWSPGRIYRGGRDGHWERLSLGQFEPLYSNGDSCHINGIAYDPNRNLLFAGCDLSYYNQGNLLLLRSPNADAPDAQSARWEVAARFTPESPAATGAARPLAVDAREPRSLYLSTVVEEWGLPARRGLLVSHDDGATWEAFDLGRVGQPPPD